MHLSYSKKLIIFNIFKIIFVLMVVILIAYFGLEYSFGDIFVNKRWLDRTFVLSAISFTTGFLLGTLELKFLERIGDYLDLCIYNLKNAWKGNWGEKKTFNKLIEILDERYKIYPNFHIPISGNNFDIDVVIIGPKGIICIEIKNIKGKFDFIGKETFKHDWHNGNSCIDTLGEYNSPSREVLRHSLALEKWLKEKGKNILSKHMLLLVGGKAIINKLEPSHYFIVKNLEELQLRLSDTKIDPYFTTEVIQDLIKLFGDKYLR
ncbi:MAG: NERD domain-containing protein [Patescibacteria group bacterium]|nr:NERD domain-containing protein [Patescibacteria group bacterium]